MIDISMWDKRNIWVDNSGALIVREGMQKLFGAWGLGISKFLGGFSVENARTQQTLHYILGVDGDKKSYIFMCNEEFHPLVKVFVGRDIVIDGPFQGGVLLNGQILMGAPGMPMFWGYVGNGLKLAEKTISALDIDFSTLSIPDGLVTSWQNRIVLGVRDSLFFSDLGSPRAFIAANATPTPGNIYFLKVSQAGMLFMGTTEGVYQISADTSLSGEIINPVFQKISEFPINGFFQACVTDKGPVALSTEGIVNVSSYTAEELPLADQRITRTLSEPVHFEDYKFGKIFSSNDGPIVSMSADKFGKNSDHLMMRLHERRQIYSWFQPANQEDMTANLEVISILEDSDGTNLVMTTTGVFVFFGNVDTIGDEPVGRSVIGTLAGGLPVDPVQNPVLRSITTASDNIGTRQYASIQGIQKSATPHRVTEAIPVCDLTKWYDYGGGPDSSKYYTRRMHSVRHLFSLRTNDLGMEIGVEGSGFRVGLVSFGAKGPGQFRPQDGKALTPTTLEF